MSIKLPSGVQDAILDSATKAPRKKQTFAEFTEKNFGAIQQWSQFGLGLGSSIADTVSEQKIKKEQAKATLQNIKAGGVTTTLNETPPTGGGGGTTPVSDTILGMSKPVFFGGIGLIIVIAGVGIYFATRGGDSAPAGK